MLNPLPMRLLALICLCACTFSSKPLFASPGNEPFTEIKMLSTFLYAANGNMADGNRCVFAEQYSNDVDRYDAVKMTNPGENFGLFRGGLKLAVEARQPISIGDTLFYNMSNLLPQVYTVNIQVQYLAGTDAMAEFVDRFTNTRHLVNLSATTSFPVVVTSDPASRAADRFYLVFNDFNIAGGPLPVTFTSLNANRQANQSIAVKWNVDNEIKVDHYEIERSSDAVNFKFIAAVKANSAVLLSKEYNYTDLTTEAGNIFYRIKAVDLDGKFDFSKVVSLEATGFTSSMVAYPNPAATPQLSVQLKAAIAGNYTISMLSTAGQTVYTTSFTVRNADHLQRIPVSQLGNGYYIVKVTGPDNKTMVQSIVIKK